MGSTAQLQLDVGMSMLCALCAAVGLQQPSFTLKPHHATAAAAAAAAGGQAGAGDGASSVSWTVGVTIPNCVATESLKSFPTMNAALEWAMGAARQAVKAASVHPEDGPGSGRVDG